MACQELMQRVFEFDHYLEDLRLQRVRMVENVYDRTGNVSAEVLAALVDLTEVLIRLDSKSFFFALQRLLQPVLDCSEQTGFVLEGLQLLDVILFEVP